MCQAWQKRPHGSAICVEPEDFFLLHQRCSLLFQGHEGPNATAVLASPVDAADIDVTHHTLTVHLGGAVCSLRTPPEDVTVVQVTCIFGDISFIDDVLTDCGFSCSMLPDGYLPITSAPVHKTVRVCWTTAGQKFEYGSAVCRSGHWYYAKRSNLHENGMPCSAPVGWYPD